MRSPRVRNAVVVAALALAALTVDTGAHAAGAANVPGDPGAVGAIALCGPSDQPITGGLLSTKPFVWKAIGTVTPPPAVAGTDGLAILDIYQERPNVAPSQWSGDNLTAFTRYSTPAHPTVQATSKDFSLGDIVATFPPLGQGYFALRMEYGRVGSSNSSSTYAVTTIQVIGKTWHVVAGATRVACSSGHGTSGEVYAGVATAAPAPGYVAAVSAASKTAGAEPAEATATAGAPTSDPPGGVAAAHDGAAAMAAADPSDTHSASAAGWIALAVAGGLALLGGGFFAGRRRRS